FCEFPEDAPIAAKALMPLVGSNTTPVAGNPEPPRTFVQVLPPSVERNTPSFPERVPPANRICPFEGWTASEPIEPPPVTESKGPTKGPGRLVHVVPPSVDLRIPAPV